MRERGKYDEKALEILLNFCKLEVQLIGMAAKNEACCMSVRREIL